MTFKEFCDIVREKIASGRVEISADLTDLDLAVLFALGKEKQERGVSEMEVTVDDVWYLIGKHCGIEERERVFNMED